MDVRPIRPEEECAAGELIFEATRLREPDSEELTDFLTKARLLGTDLSRQVVAVTPEGEVVCCGIYFLSEDGTGTAATPFGRTGRCDSQLKARLMRSLREKAHADGVAILQVFCDEHDIETPRLLIESGFKELALMVFLERRVSVRDRNLSPAQDIGWVGYSPELNKDFADTVESTFEGTLDCPNLPRWSSASETLAGWRRRGTFDPGLWWLARVDGEYAGCLLLTHYPERERFEVTYVGVVPKRRGRGLGRKMMEKGLFEIAGRHAKSVLALAVDAQNSPAVRMYESLGFTVAERRKVFFSLLAQPSRSR